MKVFKSINTRRVLEKISSRNFKSISMSVSKRLSFNRLIYRLNVGFFSDSMHSKHLNSIQIKDLLKNLSSDIHINQIKDENFNIEANMVELTDSSDFEQLVLKSDYPVIIEFYADWCAPCKKLLPIVTQKYREMKKFRFVKVNIDENPELADNFNVTSIPVVSLIYKGNIVDSLIGVPNSEKIDEFFNGVSLLKGIGSNEEIFRNLLIGADEFMKNGQYDQAENMLNEAYTHKWKDSYLHLIRLSMAYICFHKNEIEKSKGFIQDIRTYNQQALKDSAIYSRKVSQLELNYIILEGKSIYTGNLTLF